MKLLVGAVAGALYMAVAISTYHSARATEVCAAAPFGHLRLAATLAAATWPILVLTIGLNVVVGGGNGNGFVCDAKVRTNG